MQSTFQVSNIEIEDFYNSTEKKTLVFYAGATPTIG